MQLLLRWYISLDLFKNWTNVHLFFIFPLVINDSFIKLFYNNSVLLESSFKLILHRNPTRFKFLYLFKALLLFTCCLLGTFILKCLALLEEVTHAVFLVLGGFEHVFMSENIFEAVLSDSFARLLVNSGFRSFSKSRLSKHPERWVKYSHLTFNPLLMQVSFFLFYLYQLQESFFPDSTFLFVHPKEIKII